MQQTKNI